MRQRFAALTRGVLIHGEASQRAMPQWDASDRGWCPRVLTLLLNAFMASLVAVDVGTVQRFASGFTTLGLATAEPIRVQKRSVGGLLGHGSVPSLGVAPFQ